MGAGFNVDGDDIRTGVGEIGQVTIRLFDHEVYVQEGAVLIGQGAQGVDDHGPDSDIGYKMTVHDVNMNILRSGAHRFFYLGAQLGEISGKDGGGEFDLGHKISKDINRSPPSRGQAKQITQISLKLVICVICAYTESARNMI